MQTQIMKITERLYCFQSVPRVHKFLFCISKRFGCTIIGVCYLVLTYEAFSSIVTSTNIRCYIQGPVQQIISGVTFIVWIITSIASFLFIYGLTEEKPIFFLIFIYTTLLLIVFNMIHSFMMFFYFYNAHSCPTPYLFGGANFFGAIVLIYFLVIVNSYYLQTVEKQQNVANVSAPNNDVVIEPSLEPVPSTAAPDEEPKPGKSSWF